MGLVTRPKHQGQGNLYHRHCQSPSRQHPTWKCEIWVRDVDLLKPGYIKDSEGEPNFPEHITCQAACAYDIYGKCTGMLSLERLNILLRAYNQSKRIGLHSPTQPPVQDAATEIVGLLQRYKLQMSSLNNIGKKARDSNMYCTPRHIMTSLQIWASVTKQKFASPLDFDPSYQAYWSKNTRDTVFEQALMLSTQNSLASLFATRIIATISCIHLWDMHFNQQTPVGW